MGLLSLLPWTGRPGAARGAAADEEARRKKERELQPLFPKVDELSPSGRATYDRERGKLSTAANAAPPDAPALPPLVDAGNSWRGKPQGSGVKGLQPGEAHASVIEKPGGQTLGTYSQRPKGRGYERAATGQGLSLVPGGMSAPLAPPSRGKVLGDALRSNARLPLAPTPEQTRAAKAQSDRFGNTAPAAGVDVDPATGKPYDAPDADKMTLAGLISKRNRSGSSVEKRALTNEMDRVQGRLDKREGLDVTPEQRLAARGMDLKEREQVDAASLDEQGLELDRTKARTQYREQLFNEEVAVNESLAAIDAEISELGKKPKYFGTDKWDDKKEILDRRKEAELARLEAIRAELGNLASARDDGEKKPPMSLVPPDKSAPADDQAGEVDLTEDEISALMDKYGRSREEIIKAYQSQIARQK